MNQKGSSRFAVEAGFAPILMVLLIAVLGIGGYLIYVNYSNNQTKSVPTSTYSTPKSSSLADETANWESYAFSSFSVKLPKGWKKENENENPIQFLNYDINNLTIAQQKGSDYKGLLKLEIYTNSTTKNLKDYVLEKKLENFSFRGKETSKWDETEITVDNQTAVRVKSDSPGFVVYVKNPKSQKTLELAFELDFDNYLSSADQILSTFKFTR